MRRRAIVVGALYFFQFAGCQTDRKTEVKVADLSQQATETMRFAGSGDCSENTKDCPLQNAAEGQENSSQISIKIERFSSNPLILPAQVQQTDRKDTSVGGPSIIRVPDFVKNKLGKYYMYFAHHGGRYIRLAYADDVRGPWSIYQPGTLSLDQAIAEGTDPIYKKKYGFSLKSHRGHIASPDVHIDAENKRLIMFFHGAPLRDYKTQMTSVAISENGIDFLPLDIYVGIAYLKPFSWKGHLYGVARDSFVKPESEVLTDFSFYHPRKNHFIDNAKMRHPAPFVWDDYLIVFFSVKGDEPERIKAVYTKYHDDWQQWSPSQPVEVLRTQYPYEGSEYPIQPSESGKGFDLHEVRDPVVFTDEGRSYLFYSIAGESGIAGAELFVTQTRQAG